MSEMLVMMMMRMMERRDEDNDEGGKRDIKIKIRFSHTRPYVINLFGIHIFSLNRPRGTNPEANSHITVLGKKVQAS